MRTGLFLSTPSVRRATTSSGRPQTWYGHFYPRPPCGGRRRIDSAILASLHEFLSTPSVRRATITGCVGIIDGPFLSTPSVRRATGPLFYASEIHSTISIHALRAEGDISIRAVIHFLGVFLSTPSVRRATCFSPGTNGASGFISIHALRAEGDNLFPGAFRRGGVISIHALRAEGDRPCLSMIRTLAVFLSTPSVRRATAPSVVRAKSG